MNRTVQPCRRVQWKKDAARLLAVSHETDLPCVVVGPHQGRDGARCCGSAAVHCYFNASGAAFEFQT